MSLLRKVIFCCLLFHTNLLFADGLQQKLDSLVKSKAYKKSAVSLLDLQKDQIVYEHNQHQALKPASILKLLITSYALENLGADYRFDTEMWSSPVRDGSIKDLVLIGGGDPNFRTEDLWVLLRRLKDYQVRSIENLYLDNSRFVKSKKRSGFKAYQAGNSALSFNFNALRFTVCPTQLGSSASLTWDPFEYPVQITGKISTSSSRSQFNIDELSARKYKISGKVHHKSICQDFYRSVEDPEKYLSYVVEQFLDYIGIKFSGKINFRSYAGPVKLLAKQQSKPLSEILSNLNKFSSNFIAEQLLYKIGRIDSNHFDRYKGLDNLSKFLTDLNVTSNEFSLHDASGLSHDNRISANALMLASKKAIQSSQSQVEFLNSLAVNRQTGTLKKRKLSQGLVLRGKTGTINAVDTLAGFVRSKSGRDFFFIIMQNDVRSNWQSEQFENKLIELLNQQ